ncbi:MAG: amidohydrolase [Vicingaceae bacterium]|nr:amidohydrolase [Vicingaceae bacterium]
MNLNVSIIQSELHWENVGQNLEMFAQKIDEISKPTDIIVLPEMFNTGFSMDSEKLAETMSGKTVAWMKAQANKADSVITGSLIVEEEGAFYNRLIWAVPNGEIQVYDKRHLFRMAGEHNYFSAGEKRLIVNYKGWRICPLICYDLRFPVWSRNTSKNDSPAYDCLIYVANWPAVRKQPWSKLLEARAIENQCYVVGVNRVGEDGKRITYTGNSVVVNPKGDVISNIAENTNTSESVDLFLSELNDFREKFPVSMDGDEFTL